MITRACNIWLFSTAVKMIFFAQNIDRRYTLEPHTINDLEQT